MSSRGSNGDDCATVQCHSQRSVHSNLHINQTPPQITHILRFCLVDWFLQILWSTGLRSVSLATTNLEVHRSDHDILEYCTFRLETANDAQNGRVDTACEKDQGQ